MNILNIPKNFYFLDESGSNRSSSSVEAAEAAAVVVVMVVIVYSQATEYSKHDLGHRQLRMHVLSCLLMILFTTESFPTVISAGG